MPPPDLTHPSHYADRPVILSYGSVIGMTVSPGCDHVLRMTISSKLHDIAAEHLVGELSFWISGLASRQGYVTEAGLAVIRFGFEELQLNRICAFHMVRNTGSGSVLARLGMRQEGCLRQRVLKWGVFEDVMAWAVLRGDWPASAGARCDRGGNVGLADPDQDHS
jgi:RimJ/RimL family protein N-acetyltransferase